jgi:hypothetical protein
LAPWDAPMRGTGPEVSTKGNVGTAGKERGPGRTSVAELGAAGISERSRVGATGERKGGTGVGGAAS